MSDRVAVEALPLIEDAFGNYIVQYVLELGFEESTVAIIDQMVGNFQRLSQQKFGSNVVEKVRLGLPNSEFARGLTPWPLLGLQCASNAGSDSLAAVVKEVMAPGALESLSTDPFGNYVVQAMLENCSEAEVPLAARHSSVSSRRLRGGFVVRQVREVGERVKGDLLDQITKTVYGKRIRQKLQVRLAAAVLGDGLR